MRALSVSSDTGCSGPERQSWISSGRTPASTTETSSASWPASAPARRRSASVLPARGPPTIDTREPRPSGVSHSIAFEVGSSTSSAMRSVA